MTHAHARTVQAPSAEAESSGPSRPFSPPTEGRAASSAGGHSFARVAPTPAGAPIQRWETFKNAYHAFTGSQIGPLPQGNRSTLDDHLRQYQEPSFFTHGLIRVNRGYGINTSEELPNAKLDEYKHLSSQVQSGTMRDSQAFAHSAWGWAKQGHVPGVLANAGGAILTGLKEGMDDHRAMKTGRY